MRFTLHTTANADAAFDAVADFGTLDQWDPFVRSSTLESGTAMEEGARYALRSIGGLMLRYELRQIDSPHHVSYQGGTTRVTSVDAIRLNDAGAGTDITVSSELEFSGWIRLIAPIVRAIVWLGGRYISLPAMRRHLEGAGGG